MSYLVTLPGIILSTILFLNLHDYSKSHELSEYQPIKENMFQVKTLEESMVAGEEIYLDFCMQCHLADGKGVPNAFPPLAGSDWLTNKRKESIHAIKYGLNGEIRVNDVIYNSAMTPLGLEDEEIADVMNYIMNSWGNTQKTMVTIEEVAAIKK
ncbi:c-type cytochrome [Aquimarina intermedia]|uniref:Cytochrome c n=1 Tax=Aquimarina intermedia TaxID=350814 RepID=A0A5S5C0L9_9FLAO|nr:cytochrome c [Aquimarina intermedia]TYP72834.1 cytochrome c [Aquimarina intermedia]